MMDEVTAPARALVCARARAGTVLALALLLLGAGCRAPSRAAEPDYQQPLTEGAPALLPLGPGDPVPDLAAEWRDRERIARALEQSLAWIDKPSSRRFFPIAGVDHARARASLERFARILETATSGEDFARRVESEFEILKSAGWDGRGGGVLFTGYCTPIFEGSRERTERFAHPLYALPPDLVKGEHGEILGRRRPDGGLEPYPTRRRIETGGLLEGRDLELVWLGSALDAYIAHVNGSALVRLADGGVLRLGYAGKNGREYRSLRDALLRAGELDAQTGNLAGIRAWAEREPDAVTRLLHRNDSFVFFTPIDGTPRGSLNVPVTAGRTLATDKSLFPRASIVYVDTRLQGTRHGAGSHYRRIMFDQDTGGAIRTAGRADIYVGQGDHAERLAGATRAPGQLYYLFLKERG